MRKGVVVALLAVLFGVTPALAAKQSDERSATVEGAIKAMEHMMVLPIKGGIPAYRLHEAYGIVIFPGTLNGGAVFAGRSGEGVLVVRNNEGGWSDPVFISLLSGSVGAQLGVESSALVLILYNQKQVEDLLKGRVLVGFSGSVATGPIGKDSISYLEPETSIVAHARNKGIFLGASFSLTRLWVDKSADGAFYRSSGIDAERIIRGNGVKTPAAASDLKMNMARLIDLGQ